MRSLGDTPIPPAGAAPLLAREGEVNRGPRAGMAPVPARED